MVGQGLKAVEGDAERQRRIDKTAGYVDVPKQHVAVLEVPDQADIDDHSRRDAPPVGGNGDLDQPIEYDRAQDYGHVEWSSRRIEDQARNNQH